MGTYRKKPIDSLGAILRGSPELSSDKSRVPTHVWLQAVGKRVAERSRPERLGDGCLPVTVATAAWAQELSMLSQSITARLAQLGFHAKQLRFRVGAVSDLPPTRAAVTPAAPVPLPADIAARVEHIDDPELRAAIAEAASYSLGRTS